MNIGEYIKTLRNPLRRRTVSFLVKDRKVLLGYKKKGFGKGLWLGIGGKVEKGESIEQAAIRELKEEVNINVTILKKVAILNFYFRNIEDESWNQQVHAFLVTSWEGEPQESEEIKPQWFDKNQVPLNEMWDDAHYWLPTILDDKVIDGEFFFNENLKVIESSINEKK